jgi:8-oxo-dGTP pyrophosphatase MutT (NUDIX family)
MSLSAGNSLQVFAKLGAGLNFQALSWTGQGAQAGVLVALTDEPEPKVILGRRALHLRLHPGEVAFPGGKREAEDASPWATALREAEEEVGITQDLPAPLGQLAPLVTRSGFEVYPCIAKVPAALALTVDPGEFDSVFLPPLAQFANQQNYRLEAMSDGKRTVMVPHYQINDDNVWGVTAAVLAQLANIALDAGLDLKRNWKNKS